MRPPWLTSALSSALTWANLLTALRLLILVPIVIAVLDQQWLLAASLFTIAVITDIFDGKLARQFEQSTPFGGLFDHATDALFVTLGCWSLAQIGLINSVLPWLIPLAFVQYMLDSRALAGIALRMSVLGKSNGVAYYALFGTGIGSQLLQWHWLNLPLQVAAWVLVATTACSMLDRAITFLRQKFRQKR